MMSATSRRVAGSSVRPMVIVVEPDAVRRRRLMAGLGRGVEGIADITDASARFHADVSGDGDAAQFVPLVVVAGPSLAAGSIVAALTAMTGADGCDRRWWAVVGVVSSCGIRAMRDALSDGVCDLVDEDAPVAVLRHAVRRAGLEVALAVGSCGDEGRSGAIAGQAPEPVAGLGGDQVLDPARVLMAPHRLVGSGPIGVFAPKGGAGASTVAVNLAIALSAGARTDNAASNRYPGVLVDADLQFGDLALMLGVEPQRSLASVSMTGTNNSGSGHPIPPNIDNDLIAGLLAVHPASGVALLGAPVDPVLADTVAPDLFHRALDVLCQLSSWLVLDLPSRLDDLVVELLERCGHILLVTTTDLASVKDARLAADILSRLGISSEAWSLVCNGVGAPGGLDVARVEQHVGAKALGVVPNDPAVCRSLLAGCPVVLETSQSPAAAALGSLANQLSGGPAPDSPVGLLPVADSGLLRHSGPLGSMLPRLVAGVRHAVVGRAG